MKNEFSKSFEKKARKDKRVFFLTGDLGFNAFENIASSIEERFINAGIAEQNMVSVAAGMAKMGMQPWVYSIATFLTLKTLEQVRNDVALLNLPVKFVGNGGGYGYGIMGETHHALEDLAIYTTLENMTCYIPAFIEDVSVVVNKMHSSKSPSYLRLTSVPATTIPLPKYAPVRKLMSGENVTVVMLGPMVHKLLEISTKKILKNIDVFCITELPIYYSIRVIIASIKKTNKLLIVEEHRKDGGLGEKLLYQLAINAQVPDKIIHLYAKGYPSGHYGSRKFHLAENGLEVRGISDALHRLYE